MKKQILVILSFLSLFVVLSSQAEATVTNGKVQYYFDSSTVNKESSASSTTKVISDKEKRTIRGSQPNGTGSSRLLQTNDQRNIFLIIIGVLILAIALLGWRITQNRRKNT